MTQLEDLSITFPHMWFKPGDEFSPEYKGCVWTGEGSQIYNIQADCLIEAFDYHCDTSQPHQVDPVFSLYCECIRLTIEWIDPGTVMLVPFARRLVRSQHKRPLFIIATDL